MAEESKKSLKERFPALLKLERGARKRIPYIQQLMATDCGAASLAMVLGYYGKNVGLDEVRHVVGTNRDGTDALALLKGARWYGMRGRGVRVEIEGMEQIPRGSILFWEFRHFVVFDRLTRNGVKIVDPASGPREVPMEQFRRAFTGVAVIVEPSEDFSEGGAKRTNSVWSYFRQILSHSDLMLRIGSISLLIRLFGLALPVLTGVLVDRVIPRADYDLLQVMVIGLTGLMVFSFLASLIRAHLNLHLRTQLETQMTLNFIDHLVDLPYDYFQTRTTGDLMVRLSSNARIRDILTSSALSAIIDGALVSIYLVLLFYASPGLGLLTLGLAAARGLVLILIRRKQKDLVSRSLEVQSRSQNYQVEMLAGMETLKSLGTEQRAVEHWSNLYVDTLNVSLEQGRLQAWFNGVLGILGTFSPIAILAFGGLQVLDGELSLGTMLAMNALAIGFLGPLDSLINTATEFQLLSSYLERIDDVIKTPREQEAEKTRPAPDLKGGIRIENVTFSYGPLAPPVVRDASFNAEPGQSVALVGRSGSGKSTLGKLLVGLYPPSSGKVFYDDVPLETLECHSVRRQLGVVTQAPFLFSGSIRSNISISDPGLNLDQVIQAAKRACIHDDIMEMPMGYETIVSTGGLSMSGGQRQRIALARALVSEPRIMLLDEATSALDSMTEKQVQEHLQEMKCTQVIIAHRLSTIMDADLILVMDGGRIVEMGKHHDLLSAQGPYAQLVEAQVETGDFAADLYQAQVKAGR